MDGHVLLTCILIILGRITDVTISTVRTIFVIQGRRLLACVLGFIEVIIWIFIAAKVIQGITENGYYLISYGLGFAAGNYLGITVENWLALGDQILMIFSRNGGEIAAHVRERGLRVTEFEGAGRDGPMCMLLLVLKRQESPRVLERILQIDADCFYVLHDVRHAPAVTARLAPEDWSTLKRK